MKKIILSMHVTLDGFVAGPNGEMDWIKIDEDVFDRVGKVTAEADTALYGRVTYGMMQSYWPTAADKPNATKHDIEHADWYKRVEKIVVSRSMKGAEIKNTRVISDNVAGEIEKLKTEGGKNIMIFGSPSVNHLLMEHNLIDDYWLFVNPVILGQGIPMFAKVKHKIGLKWLASEAFSCGVTGLHYAVER